MYHVASWHWGKLQELPHTLIACQGCTYMPFGVASAVTNTEHASPWPRPNILDLGGRLSTCTTSWGATRALEKWTLTQPWSFLVFDRFLVCAYSNLLQHHCLGFYRNMLWMAEGPSYLYHSPLMSLQPLSQCETTVHHRKNLASCNMWVNLKYQCCVKDWVDSHGGAKQVQQCMYLPHEIVDCFLTSGETTRMTGNSDTWFL